MGTVLAVVFIVVPIVELAVIVAVADWIGGLETIALLLAVSLAGAVLAKREGLGVYRRFRSALGRGEIPSAEITDGFLVLFGAALLLTPGFVTDALGLLLLAPLTRSHVKRHVWKAASGWVRRRSGMSGRGRRGRPAPKQAQVVQVRPIQADKSGGDGESGASEDG
ncbi:MAG: FxsA family protein [Actinobacteria bacterium]|nr:FxsA family protein [Actinomycetota bacterium]